MKLTDVLDESIDLKSLNKEQLKKKIRVLKNNMQSIPQGLSTQAQYDAVDDMRDELADLQKALKSYKVQGDLFKEGVANVDADVTYRQRVAQVHQLLSDLSQAVQEHSRRQAKSPTNWGYVGDMAHLTTTLQEALEFIENGEQNREDA